MVEDFSGYATKNNVKCTDGRTILPGAFKHLDKMKVPLVWQHQYDGPENVLGHAMLENRDDGVFARAFFNETDSAVNARLLVEHGDINALSIYANNLSQRGSNVLHGDIKEVSLVLAGANPGAFIQNINIRHGDDLVTVEDEAIIFSGEEFTIQHQDAPGGTMATDTTAAPEKTVKDVFDSMNEEQQNVVYYMIGEAIDSKAADLKQSDDLEQTEPLDIEQLTKDIAENIIQHFQEDPNMTRNVFESADSSVATTARPTLTHSQLNTIVTDAQRLGSLKESFLEHATEYGIENIDFLFPDAKTLSNSPDLISRRTEWVANVLSNTKHSPFSRIKSLAADITADEARAKGYVKGNLKKDEIIKLLRRVTTPTTIYKKQKLDRDDIVDITEIDVVAWLKMEMRLMLDEELAAAVLIGDGREPDDEDKIDEDHLRPIAFDEDMYNTTINLATSSTPAQTIEQIIRARKFYKGTGTPSLYTTDDVLTDLLLDKDTLGRRYYDTEAELAAALRVSKIVIVEAMERVPDVVAIIVNLTDYTIGADKGGEVNMFDDFDIDYNQQKYLIETRVSGALTKPKSSVTIKVATGTVVIPTPPTYVPATHVITIPTQTGVIYSVGGVDQVAGPMAAITETTEVVSRPAATYSFVHGTDADWTFVF